MGKLEDLVPLAKTTYRELLDDMDAKENVRADVATKVLESEGYLKTTKSDGGKTFVLNLKSDDVAGAFRGMRTVFSGEEGEELIAEPPKKIAPVEKKKKGAKKNGGLNKRGDDEATVLQRAIEAEKGVLSAKASAEEREDAVHGEGDV